MSDPIATPKVWDRALVSGGSSGIGEAMARQLGAAGTSLVLVARSVDRLEALSAEIGGRSGVEVEVLGADLGDRDQLARVEERVATTEAPVDLLVNNAGFGFPGRFGEIPVDDEEAEILVNVLALVRLSHAAARRMPDTGGGAILNVGSSAGFQPGPGGANYAATKAYVLSFSQALHEELRGRGVTCTVLCPGPTRTEFQQRGSWSPDKLPGVLWQEADAVARSGLDAAAKGHAVEVTGLSNKVMSSTARLAPMGMSRWFAAQFYDRMR